jgi:hypothetical protein
MVQRRFFKKGRLDEDRRERLEALPGWTWDPREAAWEQGASPTLRATSSARATRESRTSGAKMGTDSALGSASSADCSAGGR